MFAQVLFSDGLRLREVGLEGTILHLLHLAVPPDSTLGVSRALVPHFTQLVQMQVDRLVWLEDRISPRLAAADGLVDPWTKGAGRVLGSLLLRTDLGVLVASLDRLGNQEVLQLASRLLVHRWQ